MPETEHQYADLVMEGGGIKGIALVGALAVLEARGYRYVNLAGTSAGAIVASLIAAGYSAEELRSIFTDLDFTQFMDSSPHWLPPKTRAAYNLLVHWGMYKGDRFVSWLRELLLKKGVRTFGDLKRGIPDRQQVYKLRVVASDITRGKMIVLPNAITVYGIDPDELEVVAAVRMSMAIPGFFRPVTLYAPESTFVAGTGFVTTQNPCYIVDGGLLSNFPMSLFDGPGMDQRPTFGIRLTGHGKPPVTKYHAHSVVSYIMAMFNTATGASDAYYLDAHDFIRTIEIDNLGISPTKFDIDDADKRALFDEGARAARVFLETWSFAEWKTVYKNWAGASRRSLIHTVATKEHQDG